MTKILWDNVGERVFERGVDRGVLYLADRSGVAWNGITGVSEERSDTTTEPVYLDGVKYLDIVHPGDFAATLTAYTYPDAFLPFDGIAPVRNGLYLDSQAPQVFGLSYRTLVGNDLLGDGLGYKIHILYNLTAVPTNKAFSSIGGTTDASEFSWSLVGVPESAPGYRPTVHAIFDSRAMTTTVKNFIENALYGTSSTAPRLPTLVEILNTV